MRKNSIFRCPRCKKSLMNLNLKKRVLCRNCGFVIVLENGIPLLVRNRALIDKQIKNASIEGKTDWYETPQSSQWDGPYRHHLFKRRLYLNKVLMAQRLKNANPLWGVDLGCGDGENLIWLSKYVDELFGSDYNLVRLIRAARKNTAKQIFMADITDYPIQDNAFDIIFFNHVLEHIRDDGKALAEAFRILKPGGLLILGVPNEGAFFWRLAYWFQPEVLAASDHVQFYTGKTLKQKTEQAGFRIKAVHPIGWGVPHWRLDEKIRNYKIFDDIFEIIGKVFLRSQATSLYLVATK